MTCQAKIWKDNFYYCQNQTTNQYCDNCVDKICETCNLVKSTDHRCPKFDICLYFYNGYRCQNQTDNKIRICDNCYNLIPTKSWDKYRVL